MDWFNNWYNNVNQNWRDALKEDSFRRYFLLNFLISLALYFATIHWVRLNSSRPGMVLDDPLYYFLSPRDFSPLIFFLTYSPVVIFLVYIAQYPLLLHRAFNSFVAVFMIRAICIHFIPLSPAPGIIVLNDPVTGALADESHVLNDLFFSGHVGDLMTLFFICGSIYLRRYILLCAVLVGFLLVWQRVHYSVDIIAAPFFSYLCFWVFVKKDFVWGYFLNRPVLAEDEG